MRLTMRRISEVNTIPDIRERNDRPRDKQPKHQVTSTVQRQMVQKFVKELSDSAKQPDRSDSAERTATEQVETTVREIVYEAVQLPRRAIQHPARKESADSSAGVQPEQSDQPHHAPESPRERTDAPRTRSDATPPQSTSIPAAQEQARRAYVQQTAKTATPAPPITSEQPQHTTVTVPSAENAPRQRTEDVRTRPDPKQPQNASAPTPQEQARRVYVQQAAKEGAPAPSIMPEQPRERHVVRSAPLTENTPRQRTEDVRTHSALKQRQSAPTAQEQGRRAYVKRAKKSRAEKSSARDNLYTEQVEIRLADDMPQSATPPIRERPTITELRGEPRPEPTPENASNVQHIKQTGTWTPRGTEPYSRGIEQPIRGHTGARFAVRAAGAGTASLCGKTSAALSKSIHRIHLSIQLPAIREKPKPNAAPREKPRRDVSIRTRDTEQISAPKVQPKTPASKTAAKRARKSATQDAQRKMLKKSNNRAIRAAAAAAKKLVEAAAKAVKELISALASLGGGTALFVVFSIVIVAGAFLASPLGILFADEQESEETVPLATTIAEIQGEYHAELERLQNGDYVSVQIIGQAPDWREVVAVFASKTAGAEDGVDVFTLDEERVELLRQVFWDMCEITTATQTVDVPDSNPDDDVDDSHTETALTITITAKTAEQMRLEYDFSKYQNDALDILLENLGSLNIPMGSLTISQEDAIALLENLPDDLDPARKAVVETAVQLVGRVSYFWGGKSLTLGWDDRWGVPTEVTASGSGSTGTVRLFGLDCSGFVDWTFYNATNGSYYPGRGGGAATQHSYCTNISWSDAQPGDLVFYPDDSHVGIVGGKDADGNLLIVHCSGGANGVVITGAAGFTSVARPECFS